MLHVVLASTIIVGARADAPADYHPKCPSWVGQGQCVTNNALIHAGSCYNPDNVNGGVQCLPPSNMGAGYVCPPENPAKCSFQSMVYNIENVNSGKVLNVDGASVDDGANVQQWDYRGAASQWTLQPVGDAYTIKNAYTGKVLNVDGGSADNGANVQQWDNPAETASHWTLQSAGDAYTITNVNSGKVLNVAGGGIDNGANVQQWDNPQETSSQWRFQVVQAQQMEVSAPSGEFLAVATPAPTAPPTNQYEATNREADVLSVVFFFVAFVICWLECCGPPSKKK